jgi:NADP-dependent 3-hydroxy acid dehydrogenase YdfG
VLKPNKFADLAELLYLCRIKYKKHTSHMKKLAFITGASSGIGAACARKFAQNGYNLILNARSIDKLLAIKEELESSYSTSIHILAFDVRDRQAAQHAINSLPKDFQAIDILVNNAGLALGMDKEYEGNEENYDTMIETNITALLMITRMVVPSMIERNSGHIINIGSVAGDAAYPGGSVYCATKAAVKILSDGLRMDLMHTPLRVTNVKPGLVETNFSLTRFAGDKQRADQVYKGIQPLTGDDIADVVYYAASAPAHVQIAEVLVLATHQASGSHVYRQ